MSSIDIISRLGTRFQNGQSDRDTPDLLTRDIGGNFRHNHPYISGYFQVMFGLPEKLFQSNAKNASKWLHTTCESFTPHSQTLNTIDIQGQGQIGSSFVTSILTNRDISFGFREYQNLPILNIIRQWTSIMDPFTGVSPLSGNEFLPENYKGWVAVAQTKPVRSQGSSLKVEDLEECYIYNGVVPTNIPTDTLAEDITGNDSAQLQITFKFDGAPLTSAETGVSDQVIKLFNGMQTLGKGGNGDSTFQKYSDSGLATAQWTPVVKIASSTGAKV